MSALRARMREFLAWMSLAPAGRALASRALTMAPRERAAWLEAQPHGVSFHTLHALLDLAYEHLDDAPAESIALTTLVLDLIGKQPRDAFGARFREHLWGRAWHEQANALRPSGNLLASRRAYRRAARIFVQEGTGELELAAAKRGEALVRHHLGESDAALRMLRTAGAICSAHRDTAGIARCKLYEGVVHFENDRFDAAAAAFEEALLHSTRLGDELTIARLRLNLGNCSLERGERGPALRDFAAALQYFDRAGMMADRKRVAWAMAQILADDGFLDRAIQTLENVAEEMDAAGLNVDAALARRDIVEVLVLSNHLPRAAVMARSVLETLAKAGLFQEALWTVILLQHAESGKALDDDQS